MNTWVARTPPELLLQKFAVFVGLYAAVIALPLLTVWGGSAWLRQRLGETWLIVPVGLCTVLATIAPLLYLSFMRQLEARVLKEQRRYHRTLIAASSGMTRIRDLTHLCRLIVYIVHRTIRLSHTCVFYYDHKERRYVVKAMRYQNAVPADLALEDSDALIKVLQASRDVLLVDELRAKAEAERTPQIVEAQRWMERYGIRLIVPTFSSQRLLGFLAAGAKRTQDPYTTDDIAVFSALANQAALAIENAIFFEELRNNEAYMIQSEKLASLGQLASGMAHEIHNPLTIISGEAQLYLERFRGKDPQTDEVLTSIIQECRRAADITRRILRFAKPAPADLTPVDLKATVDESLLLAGYQVRLERVERQVNIPDGLPKVRASQNQLQEVCLNLVLNAYQAMGERGGKLFVSATTNNGTVELKVRDTGPGIPQSKLTKVFDPFYTTKSNGTGLGLFVCQRIIQSHGGTLEVQSREGEGACFTIRLPACEP